MSSRDTIDTNSILMVVVNYNAGAMLEECVRTALKDVGKIVVVDNASSDSSIEMLESVFSNEPKLSIIRNSKNLGFSAACNIGMATANSQYILFLNPDCFLQESAVEKLLMALELQPSVGMVGGLLIDPDGKEQGGGRRAIPTPWRSFVRAFGLSRLAKRWPRLFYDFHLHKQPLPDKPIAVEAISGACMLVKRKVMQEVGLWDEEYFLHCEDLDLSMRFRQHNWTILFVPNALIIHYLGVCSRSRPIFVEWHKHKGMMRFYKKFFRYQYPGMLMWLVTLGVWFRFGNIAAYYMFKHVSRWLGFSRGK